MKRVLPVSIVPATPTLCGRLIAHVSEEDNEDMVRGWGVSSAHAIMTHYALYKPSYIVMHGNEPMLIFGCCGDGALWMMRGDHMEAISIRFIYRAKKYLDEWLDKYKYLVCEFWGENKKLKRYMKWCGFTSTDLDNGYVRCEKWAQQ